ncbi:MAG: universal stress protein [Candidatus Nanopelagicales bacterium]|jgi:nucleotide-binding universal stress UspA family protein|nr:universal stress protein [Candidatus Nanopelagicales bacterium]
MTTSTQIVVGYDGSPDARAALDWAVLEAASRNLGIRVVHCEPDLAAWEAATASMSGAPAPATTVPHEGQAVAGQAAEVVTAAGIPVTTVVTAGTPAGALVEQSRSATMVVIGSRGHGSISSAILGSTVSHVASHAHCPVIVVRAEGVPGGPVVVGVDGSPESEEVVGWAIDHASRHGLALEVLHSYAIPVYPGVVPYVPPVEITAATAGFEQRVTAEVLAGWRERYPDVEVTTNIAHGRPAPALVEASGRASLTVVGSRGRGAFLGMLLGSTSQSLLHHATGSVAVLRHRSH